MGKMKMKKITKSEIKEMLSYFYYRYNNYQDRINYVCVYTRDNEYNKPYLDYSLQGNSSQVRYNGEFDEETYKELTDIVKSYVYDKEYTQQELIDILYENINDHFQSFL